MGIITNLLTNRSPDDECQNGVVDTETGQKIGIDRDENGRGSGSNGSGRGKDGSRMHHDNGLVSGSSNVGVNFDHHDVDGHHQFSDSGVGMNDDDETHQVPTVIHYSDFDDDDGDVCTIVIFDSFRIPVIGRG